MQRGSNPFDVFPEDALAGSRNNPFLHDCAPEMGLSLRLARLKEEMREYEKRMSQVWVPPQRDRQSVDWEQRRRVMRAEGPCVPTTKTEEDSSKLQYRDRLSYMRSSLETKKKEIESALSDSTPLPPAPVPLSNPPSKPSTLPHVSVPATNTHRATDISKDQEIAALRLEQVQLRGELAQLKARLEQLESRSAVQLFEESEDWAQPRPRPSFGRGNALSRASIASLPQG